MVIVLAQLSSPKGLEEIHGFAPVFDFLVPDWKLGGVVNFVFFVGVDEHLSFTSLVDAVSICLLEFLVNYLVGLSVLSRNLLWGRDGGRDERLLRLSTFVGWRLGSR